MDTNYTVYAAATSCRCVLKISPQGKVETIITTEPPWYPTGVAVFRGEVYVLECKYVREAVEADQYPPRVRKLGRDGKITTIIDLSSPRANAGPERH